MARWHTVAFIPAGAMELGFAFTDSIDLGNGVRLDRVPAKVPDACAALGYTWPQLARLMGDPGYVLIREYEAESLGEAEPESAPEILSKQSYATSLIQVANLAIWLVRPTTKVHYRSILHIVEEASGSWTAVQYSRDSPFFVIRPGDAALSLEDLAQARELGVALRNLSRSGPLAIAVGALHAALREPGFYTRYAVAWIALEALCGPTEPNEVTFRISQNAALLLGDGPGQRQRLFDDVKKDYGKRSKVVHGEIEAVKPGEWPALMERAEDWARDAILRILKTPGLKETFANSKVRDRWFRDRVLGEVSSGE